MFNNIFKVAKNKLFSELSDIIDNNKEKTTVAIQKICYARIVKFKEMAKKYLKDKKDIKTVLIIKMINLMLKKINKLLLNSTPKKDNVEYAKLFENHAIIDENFFAYDEPDNEPDYEFL